MKTHVLKRILFLLFLSVLPSCALHKSFSLFDKTNVVTEEYHITRHVSYTNPKNDKESDLIEKAFHQQDTIMM